MWLDLRWSLNAWRFNEKNDEQGLHIALVRITDGRVNVHAHSTGILGGSGQVFWGRVRSHHHVPNSRSPFLGVIVRALEYDSSSGENRGRAYDSLAENVRLRAQEIVDAGRTPTQSDLAAAAEATYWPGKVFVNDDDLIGTWTQVFPDFGDLVGANYDSDGSTGNASPGFLAYLQSQRISGEDAIWDVVTWPVVLTGDPGNIPEFVSQQNPGWGWIDPLRR